MRTAAVLVLVLAVLGGLAFLLFSGGNDGPAVMTPGANGEPEITKPARHQNVTLEVTRDELELDAAAPFDEGSFDEPADREATIDVKLPAAFRTREMSFRSESLDGQTVEGAPFSEASEPAPAPPV